MIEISSPGFVELVDKFSDNRLKHQNELLFLISSSLKNERSRFFQNAVFTAKYINGLKRVLKAGSGNPEITNIDQIKGDLINNYQKLAEQIKSIIEGDESSEAARFKEEFLSVNPASFEKLNSLIDDLEWVKIFLNEQKK